jgi:hypothetical protein
VHYDRCSTARAEVLDALGHPQPGQPRPGAVANALVDAVAKHLADTALHALLAALI